MKNVLKIKGLWILMAIAFLASCKTADKPVQNAEVTPLKKKTTRSLLAKLAEKQAMYDWFATKAKIKFRSDAQNINFAAHIRIQKDSLIWMSLSKLGIEGARAMITPDKATVLFRQDKTYMSEPFDMVMAQYNVPLTFDELQELLVGNLIAYEDRKMEGFKSSGSYILTGAEGGTSGRVFLNASNYLLRRVELRNPEGDVDIDYDDYKTVEEQTICHKKHIFVRSISSGNMEAEITYSKVEIDQQPKIPFSIPSRYSRL